MKVGITGATGFIGKILVEHCLDRNYSVRVLTRSPDKLGPMQDKVEIISADLTADDVCLSEFFDNLDIIFHCAGEIRNESRMYDLHVNATKKLVNAAKHRVSKWVQLSSVGAYGEILNGTVTEDTLENPQGEYETTKTLSDNIVKKAASSNYFDVCIVRPSNVIGKTMTNNSLFSMIKMIKRGLFFYIGGEKATTNYVHVNNVVEALLLCATSDKSNDKTYILSESCTLEEAVNSIAGGLNKKAPSLNIPESITRLLSKIFSSVPGFPLSTSRINALTSQVVYDGSLIEKELGFEYSGKITTRLAELAVCLR